jgi:hypothetical protein
MSASVSQLASVEVTLSFREKLPIPETENTTRNRVAIVGRTPSFRNAVDARASLMVRRYQIVAKI